MLERNVKDTKNAIIAKITMIFVNAKVLKVLKLLISTHSQYFKSYRAC